MKRTRIPKLFRKPVSKKKLEKKILRRIHIEKEKRYLRDLLEEDDRGKYYIPPDRELTQEDIKRLKNIAKGVKKNKGILTTWKAGIVGVIIVAVVGFNLFFKNRLIERAAERGLESVFNAAVDIEGTDFSLIRGTIGFDHLTIADEDRPMRNLIELGRTRLDLDVGRALSRKVIFDEIACREIRFDTPRSVSGALPGSAADSEAAGEKQGGRLEELAEQAGAFALEVGRESAERLIAEYSESLTAPPLIEAAQERYIEMSLRWSGQVEQTDETVRDLRSRAAEIIETDITTLDTPKEIEAYLSRLNSLKETAEGTRGEVESAYAAFRSDLDYVRESTGKIAAAIEKDVAFLEEAVGSFTADAGGTIAAVAEPLIRERLGRIFTYGEKIVRIYNRLNAGDRRGKGRFSDRGRRGTNVSFPSVGYPSFLIKYFEVSTGSEGKEGYTRLRISDLTGEQDLWGKPAAAAFSASAAFGPGTDLLTGVIIDSRTGSEHLFDGTAAAEGIPLDITGGLEAISIRGIKAVSKTTFDLRLAPDLSGSGRLAAGLSGLEIDFTGGDSIVGNAVEEILTDIDTVVIDTAFDFRDGLIEKLSVTTNIDTLLADRIGSYLREQAERAAAEVEAAFREYIAVELETNEVLRGEIAEKGKELLEDIRSIEDLEQAIEKEKKALKDRARREVEKQTGELEDKAREQLEGLGDQLNLPSF